MPQQKIQGGMIPFKKSTNNHINTTIQKITKNSQDAAWHILVFHAPLSLDKSTGRFVPQYTACPQHKELHSIIKEFITTEELGGSKSILEEGDKGVKRNNMNLFRCTVCVHKIVQEMKEKDVFYPSFSPKEVAEIPLATSISMVGNFGITQPYLLCNEHDTHSVLLDIMKKDQQLSGILHS